MAWSLNIEMFNTAYILSSDTYCFLFCGTYAANVVSLTLPVVLYSEMLEAQMGERVDMGSCEW